MNFSKERMQKIDDIMKDADKYPLHVRIAVGLSQEGHDELDFAELKATRFGRCWNNSIAIMVQNSLRDIERGFLKITPELQAVAIQLN